MLWGAVLVVGSLAVIVAAVRLDFVQLHNDWPWATWLKWAVVFLVLLGATWTGGTLASKAGRSLQRLALVRDEDDHEDDVAFTWKFQSVTNPRGVAVGWSVLYGMGYELIALALLADPLGKHEQWWYRAALATAIVFAVSLVLVTPRLLPILQFRDIRRGEQARAAKVGSQAAYAADLTNRGLGYRHYVTEGSAPGLTDAGRRLRREALTAPTLLT